MAVVTAVVMTVLIMTVVTAVVMTVVIMTVVTAVVMTVVTAVVTATITSRDDYTAGHVTPFYSLTSLHYVITLLYIVFFKYTQCEDLKVIHTFF